MQVPGHPAGEFPFGNLHAGDNPPTPAELRNVSDELDRGGLSADSWVMLRELAISLRTGPDHMATLAREGRRPDVDHFVPWSRYPNDAIQNLVVAHQRCNLHKSDFLAAADHVAHWTLRMDRRGDDLTRIASSVGWETDRDRTLGVARGVYSRLPEDMPLWVLQREFAADLARVRPFLG